MTAERTAKISDPELAKLKAEIVKISREVKGQMGLYMKHVESGKELSIDSDKIFPLGSVFKIAVMMEVYRQADEGLLDLDEKVKLESRNFCIGSGILQYLTPGLEMTIRDLVTLMIIATDNTASETLWKRVGIQRVNMLIRDLGLAKTSIYLPWREGFLLTMGKGPFKELSAQEAARKWKGLSDLDRMKILNDIDTQYANLSIDDFRREYETLYGMKEEKKFKIQREYDQVFDNIGTPREIGAMLEKILKDASSSSRSGKEMLALLTRNPSGATLPHLLSDDVVVAAKTGITAGTANSAEIIFVGSKSHIVLCIFFKNLLEKSPDKAQMAEARISRLIYDHFTRVKSA